MYQQGDFITPTLEGRPWLEKPPLLFWMLLASFSTFGPCEWAARLPNALIALATAVGLGIFAGAFRGLRCGFLTFLCLTTSLMYVGYSRAASTDLLLTAATTLFLLAAFMAINRCSFWWALLGGLALGLTVLAKGFVALPLVLVILLLYLFVTGKPFPYGLFLVAAAAAVSVALPWLWLAWERNGENFLITFFVNQHLARVATDLHHHSQPFWYFFPVLLGGFFPWVLFLPSSARELWRQRKRFQSSKLSLDLFLWLWAIIPFLFFSVSTGKLAGYILPIFPAIAVLVAIQWDLSIEEDKLSEWMLRALQVFPLLALVLSGGAIVGFYKVFREPLIGLLLAAVPIGALLMCRWAVVRRNVGATFLTLVGFTTLGLALIHTEAAPVVGRFQSTKELCLEALPYVTPQQPLIFFRFHHFTAYYYSYGKVKGFPMHHPAALRKYILGKPQQSYTILTATHGWSELEQLKETTLLLQAGNFYLVQLKNSPELAEKLAELDKKYRQSLKSIH
jgi:4-amino-4-deoxy-L-arabinose transferase-like glycosyltransferase